MLRILQTILKMGPALHSTPSKSVNDITFSGSYITLSSLPEITFNASYFIFYFKEMMSKKNSSA